MKITLIVVGKTAFEYLKEGVAIYEKRLRRYCNFNLVVLPDVKNAKNLSKAQLKTKEGEIILKKINKGAMVVLLDENGKSYTSESFAKYLEDKLMPSGKEICFVVGGAYGFSQEVYDRANTKISLSPMTFSHQMVRLFFIEQLYRGFTIINNEPYHHS